MDIIEYFVDNLNIFMNRFRPIHHKKVDNDNDEEDDQDGTIAGLNVPDLHEISIEEYKALAMLKIMSTTFTSMIYMSTQSFGILYQIDTIINGFVVAFLATPYTTYLFDLVVDRKAQELLMQKETEEYMNSFEYKYHDFLCSNIDELKSIFQDESNKEEYSRTNKKDLEDLKVRENHLTIDLPFENNGKMVMFYDDEEEAFIYYTERGDVLYNVANTCCRKYVLDKKCVNLFQDEDDLDYFKEDENVNEEQDKTTEKEEGEEDRTNSEQDIAENYEVVENKEESEEEQQTEKQSIFKTKKQSVNREDNTNVDNGKKGKKTPKKEKKINKFIHRGNMQDYEESVKEKKEAKKVDYNAFKGFWGGGGHAK